MKKVGVAILGLGVVGSGTYRVLTENHDRIAKSQNLDVQVEAVLEINPERARMLGIEERKITASIAEVVGNPAVDVVVEVIGGIEPAKTFITAALKNGKSVVTANKELISKCWAELETYARRNHVGLYFEASCVGGVPIIRTLTEGMQANNVQSMVGIINGTTNYILSKMSKEGSDYATALRQAQECGFAEADPTADVEGYDASYKIAILSSLALSERVTVSDVFRQGITDVQAVDIRLGAELGYVLKLLAIAKNTEKGVEARVHPAFVSKTHPLASVDGPFNAVLLHGDMVDDIMLYGRGAGSLPTASAVVSDICYAATRSEPWYAPFRNTDDPAEAVKINTNFLSQYYLRLFVSDQKGALSRVAGVLGENGVGIREVLQKGESKDGFATVIFITHQTEENDMSRAIEGLKQLDEVKSVESLIRVEQ